MKNIFKYASLLAAAVMLVACEGTVDNGGNDAVGNGGKKELKITVDKNLIQTYGGDFATLTVTLDGVPVKDSVTFYSGNNTVLEIPDFKFSAQEVGAYEIWASYAIYNTETIVIKATDIPIPDSPVDPQPESTDFKARILLTEFTTVGCSACPSMKTIIHDVENDATVADKVVFTECHSGLVNSVPDPCYIHNQNFEDFSKITGFPTVKLNLDKLLKDRLALKSAIEDLYTEVETIAPGIAVNAVLQDEKVVARISIKARVASSYRVGAFLLEDGIYAKQTNATAEWMHNHDNVIRYIDSQYKSSFYGVPVADISEGNTADSMISWILEDIWEYGTERGEIDGGIPWPERNNDKLHMVVFVSMMDESGNPMVVNAIDCPVNGETPYEYAK